MFRGGIRPVALAGGLLAGGTALAACGGGTARQVSSISAGGVHPVAAATTTVPSTGAPVPSTTVQAPTTVAAPASTVPAPAAAIPAPAAAIPAPVATASAPGTASTPPAPPAPLAAPAAVPNPSSSGPVLITRAFNGSINYDGQRPSSIGFSVDSTNIVSHLTWTSWGPATTVGHGTLGLNDCKPNCAVGTVTPVPATITLSGVSSGHFTAITETAGSMTNHYSFPSNWAVSAS